MGQNEYIRHYLRLINLTLFDLRRRETEKHSDLCLFYCFLLVHCIFVIFEYTILVYYYIEWRMMTIEMKWNSSYLYWRIISTNRLSSFFFVVCLSVCCAYAFFYIYGEMHHVSVWIHSHIHTNQFDLIIVAESESCMLYPFINTWQAHTHTHTNT